MNFHREPEARPSIDGYRGLVVLGGPMNVEDREALPHLEYEVEAIARALDTGVPVLGICLGAQLLAHALGAGVRPNGASEIGWYPVALTEAGASDPVLAPLARLDQVFQWHSYTFDLPAGAELLATGDACVNQAFRYGENAYGLQFHLEMNGQLIERWLTLPRNRAKLDAMEGDARDRIRGDTESHLRAMESAADIVFSNFLDRVGRPTRRVCHPSR